MSQKNVRAVALPVQINASQEAELRLAALRNGIQKLSLLDRLLVAMHFGARLSHHVIGLELTIPSATISHRLKRAVQDLSLGLAQSGFQGELDADGLGDAVCSGLSAPSSLYKKVHHRISARPSFGFMLRN